MKSILISIKPEWTAKILNGEKTIEIRKTAPKCDLPIDVYIYCTKAKNKRKFTKIIPPYVARRMEEATKVLEENGCTPPYRMVVGRHCFSDGKVIAKFRLKNYLRIFHDDRGMLITIAKASCLNIEEMKNYANGKDFYAWYISDLEIFDEPKPLSEFGLKRAPQSYCYIDLAKKEIRDWNEMMLKAFKEKHDKGESLTRVIMFFPDKEVEE